MKADVHAVVVRWRGGDEVAACVTSLLSHGGSRLAGVTVVDSGSGDGGAERLAADFPEINVLPLEDNLGFAHAANCGAAEAREDLLLLLNPDTEVLPGSLEELAEGLDDRDRAGTVPLLEGYDGRSQHRWQLRRFPSVVRLATGRSGGPAFATPPDEDCIVAQPAAAAWLVRREVRDALNGFDEAYAPARWEHVDFCLRLEHHHGIGDFPAPNGFTVRPQARVLHHGGSSLAWLGNEAFLTAYHRNLVRLVKSHHSHLAPGILGALRLTLGIKAITRPSRRRAYLAALIVVSNRDGSTNP